MSLPQFNSEDVTITLLQNTWAKELNPIIEKPFNSGLLIKNVPLVTGKNTINHKLDRPLQGWMVTRQRGSTQIYDLQDINPLPSKNLILMATSGVAIDLFVF